MYHFKKFVCQSSGHEAVSKVEISVARPKEFRWGVPLWNFDSRNFGGTADTFGCFDIFWPWWNRMKVGDSPNGHIVHSMALRVRLRWMCVSCCDLAHCIFKQQGPSRTDQFVCGKNGSWQDMDVHRGWGAIQTMLQTIACQTFWVKKRLPIKLYTC